MSEPPRRDPEGASGQFRELVRYTLAGYGTGLALAALLDHVGLQRSGWAQWLVRTLAGEGESVFEGLFALRQRLRNRAASLAEAYGWGKFGGMAVPWVVDAGSRLAGVDLYGVPGFYIPFAYGLADQIGANIAGLVFLRRRLASWRAALGDYLRQPVMVAGLGIIFLVPTGLLVARLLGFSPTTQLRTALETIAANLCWVPPVVGWVAEHRGPHTAA